jgi:hypothetical protein
MLQTILWAIFSPAFEKVLNEIWQEYKKHKSKETEQKINAAFKTAREQKDTKPLAEEIGKLIK